MELEPYLKEWRELSKQHNASFFAFTLVREPLSFVESYYNFFYKNCRFRWCERDQNNENYQINDVVEEQFLEHLVPNRQCFLLRYISTVCGMQRQVYDDCAANEDDCDDVYNVMVDSLDWVGTTKNLNHDTLPMLSYMLTGSFQSENHLTSIISNVHHKKFSIWTNSTESFIKQVKDRNLLDQQIYDNVEIHFLPSRWHEFDEHFSS